jgi:predicted NACHT family NTPase
MRSTGPAELHSRLVAGPNLQEWLKGKPWNVFLDGLDEALAQHTQMNLI